MQRRLLVLALALPVLGGCATKRDLRDLGNEIEAMRAQQAQAMKELQQQNAAILDSMRIHDIRLRGDLSTQLVQVQRQLVQIQELTGQGQQTLAGLRQQLKDQEAALRAAMTASTAQPSDSGGVPAAGAVAGSPDDLLATARGAMQRGSYSTARLAYQEYIRSYPQNPKAAQAQLGIGETYEKSGDEAKALEAYQQVLQLYPNAAEAPTALFRAAMIEVERDRTRSARTLLNQLVTAYPDSPEAPEARAELKKLED
jgi:tol-pal system protein YbgF